MAETKCIPSEEALHKPLEQVHQQLQILHSAVITIVCALRHQNSERDEDIARTLLYTVGDRLGAQVDRIAELVASVHPLSISPDELGLEARH